MSTRTILISLISLLSLFAFAFASASETYSILFHKAASYEAADAYVREMPLDKSMIFIQQRKNGEYWVLYGQMPRGSADKTYDNLVQKCKWIRVVPTNETRSGSDRVAAYPETVTNTIISNTYINRIIAPYGRQIKDIVIEKESGVQVQIDGRNAFLTLLKKKDPMTNDTLYQECPISVYVVLEPDIVYTIIASPTQAAAKTIELKYDNEKLVKNLELFHGIPLEKKVVDLIKSVMTDTIPESFTTQRVGEKIALYRDIDLYHANNVIVEGEGLTLKEMIVAVKRGDMIGDTVALNEKQFLIPELTQYPLGIALEDFELNRQTTKTRLFIVERTK